MFLKKIALSFHVPKERACLVRPTNVRSPTGAVDSAVPLSKGTWMRPRRPERDSCRGSTCCSSALEQTEEVNANTSPAGTGRYGMRSFCSHSSDPCVCTARICVQRAAGDERDARTTCTTSAKVGEGRTVCAFSFQHRERSVPLQGCASAAVSVYQAHTCKSYECFG